jgi:UDP-N-acetyl-D-galactosamine dehydrogenase
MKITDFKIGIIGLGYVGLPLAIEFGKKTNVIGFDVNKKRINDLKNHYDITLEVETKEFELSKNLLFSSDPSDLKDCNFYIVTVPTPIDINKNPDISFLLSATKLIANYLNQDDIVVYESTVYPGATEEDCVPVLESESKLKLNKDFFVGYSPERINPGDKTHRLPNIVKVVAGSNKSSADIINFVYSKVIVAGTFLASSIKVAEAAKVIENTQRDLNIGLINELSKIFNIMNIDTQDVLEAAGTKWNFLDFKPGLVGGHCIGVDPYYLASKSRLLGYNPEIIMASRRMNDGMGKYVANNLLKEMHKKNIKIADSSILIMGYTFKENCPDTRNTKVIDIYDELNKNNLNIEIYDPWVNKNDKSIKEDLVFVDELLPNKYDAILVCVGHSKFKEMEICEIKEIQKDNSILYDLKYIFNKNDSDLRL